MGKQKMIVLDSNEFQAVLAAFRLDGHTGGEELFSSIWKGANSIAAGMLYRMNNNKVESEDIAQDVCLKLFDGRMMKYDATRGKFVCWLTTIVNNEIASVCLTKWYRETDHFSKPSGENNTIGDNIVNNNDKTHGLDSGIARLEAK